MNPEEHLYGPRSAKTALSNVYMCVHGGDQQEAKRWIRIAEDRVQQAIDEAKE